MLRSLTEAVRIDGAYTCLICSSLPCEFVIYTNALRANEDNAFTTTRVDLVIDYLIIFTAEHILLMVLTIFNS